MSVRLTGGRARGRVLREPVPAGVRPTGSRMREALFSMLGQDLTDCRVLDAFGGAGLLGLEAWSRGARVLVVEKDPRAHRGILRRGAEVGADWEVRRGDVLRLARDLERFTGVFVDPPYAMPLGPVLEALAPLAEAWLVAESASGTSAPERVADLELERRRDYGGSTLWLYRATGS